MRQDMLTNIYSELIKDETIIKYVGKRIRYYDYPENEDVNKTRVIITPLSPPNYETGGSDIGLTVYFSFQIDVQSEDRKICKEVQAAVNQIMAAFNFAQMSGGLDEYFETTKLFVDARRYEGHTRIYDNNY